MKTEHKRYLLPYTQKTAIGEREGAARRFEDRLAANMQGQMNRNMDHFYLDY